MNALYYDCETNSKHAPYAALNLLGWEWEDGRVESFRYPFDPDSLAYIKRTLGDPDILKVGFNNMNYDNVVLYNHDIEVNPKNNHDGYLLAKCVYPGMPSYGLKFLCWFLLGDPHWPEYYYEQAVGPAQKFSGIVVPELETYMKHDFHQHKILWHKCVERLQEIGDDKVEEAYDIDRAMGPVLIQQVFEGGVYVDTKACQKQIDINEEKKRRLRAAALKISNGKIKNPNSPKQVGAYLSVEESISLELTKEGNFSLKKMDLEKFRSDSSIARCMFYIRKINANHKYCKNYLEAAVGTDADGWIPSSYSYSGAATGRATSSSYYGINFQNSNSEAKKLQLVPEGWLGWWIDSTQIENVVHIYESGDMERRRAYEADENWSEYVWLCNRILGTNLGKRELDSMPSPQVSHWSVYKQWKTIKLALNFGMGIGLFTDITGIARKIASGLFEDVHAACPAMRWLTDRVKSDIHKQGYVQDTFGHVYTGPEEMAYKIVAYLIQGCGTGSLPKAQMVENFKTLQGWTEACWESKDLAPWERAGVLCGMTHDEQSGRINLSLGPDRVYKILNDLMENMTTRFEHKFDGIPLRAKLYLSRTNAKDAEELDIKKDYDKILDYAR